MRYSLLIHLHAEQHVSWSTFDATGKIINNATDVPLDTIPRDYSRLIVLIPGTDVVLTHANIPSKKRQHKIQAVPYVLEEQLTENIENLHFALGTWTSDEISVAVIARVQMSAYIARLNAVGLTPTVIMPDILAVPKPVDGWGILYLNDIVLVRTGLHAGFAIESNCLKTAFEHNPPEKITVYNNAPVVNDLGIPVTVKTHEQDIACLVQGVIENQPLNLLQGDYLPQNKIINLIRPWRLTALLLLLLAGVHVTKLGIEYEQLSQQRVALKIQIEKVYRKTFPKARKIVNPRVQMAQRLKLLRAQQRHGTNEHFLSLLTHISTPIAQLDVNIKRIHYSQKRLDIELEIGNLQSLENLKQRLSRKVKVNIHSAISRNQLVESSLRIQSK